jgi:hypothetical protein
MQDQTLNHLRSVWDVPSAGRPERLDPETLSAWISAMEMKDSMRLAWDLGLVRTVRQAERLVFDTGAGMTKVLVEALVSNPDGVSAAAWAKFTVFGRQVGVTFVPISVESRDACPLVHLTHDPCSILQEGFHGTQSIDRLHSTFGMDKAPDGFNFCFRAGSLDVENYAEDGFYGTDALVFRADHLVTMNLESGDEEIVFRGAAVDPREIVHVRQEDGVWSVLSIDGEALAIAEALPECLNWLQENETLHADRLYGVRSYPMRSLDGDGEPVIRSPAMPCPVPAFG